MPKMPVIEIIARPSRQEHRAQSRPFSGQTEPRPSRRNVFDLNGKPCVHLMQRTPYFRCALLRIAVRAHHHPNGVGGPLQDGKKHCWVRVFGQGTVFAIFGDTLYLNTRSIRHLEIQAEACCCRAEEFVCKLPVDDCHARRFLVVLRGETSPRQAAKVGARVRQRMPESGRPSDRREGLALRGRSSSGVRLLDRFSSQEPLESKSEIACAGVTPGLRCPMTCMSPRLPRSLRSVAPSTCSLSTSGTKKSGEYKTLTCRESPAAPRREW